MPVYEYKCDDCGNIFEAEQRMIEDPLTDCPNCEDGKVNRVIGRSVGIAFKGSGFYVNDNKNNNSACSTCSDSNSSGGTW